MTAPCDSPLSLAELADYWLGEEAADARATENHVFECDFCAARLDLIHDIGEGIVQLMRRGLLIGPASRALINRMSRDKLNVRQYVLEPGDTVQCTVTPGDDFLLGRLLVDVAGLGRLDMLVERPDMSEAMRIEDVTIDRAAGEVVTIFPARLAQGDPTVDQRITLVAADEGDRVVGEYTFAHTAMSEA